MEQLDNQAMNLPINFTNPDIEQEVGAPAAQIRKPSFGLSLENTAYSAIAEGSTATVGRWIDTNLGVPTLQSFLSGNFLNDQRPKLSQDTVDQLWAGSGIPDKAPNAEQYNDVAIYTLLDAAKRRQAMRDVDDATDLNTGSVVRGAVGFGLSILDPINLATGLVPAGAAFKAIGLSKAAAGMAALELAGQTGENLATRVGARALEGAIAGTVGNIPLEAITAPMRSSMGEDYSALDSAKNVALGFALGGGIHVAMGAFRPRLSQQLNAENPAVKDFIAKASEAEKEKLVTPEGEITQEGIKSFVDNEIKTKFGDSEPISKITSQDVQYKLLDASQGFNGFDEDIIGKDLSIKNDFSEAVDILNKLGSDKSITDSTPEAEMLANWIGDNTTTPRMITALMNNYNDRVGNLIKQEAKSKSGQLFDINKSSILQEEMSKIQPTAAELIDISTPDTREKALTLATAQLEDDLYPTVDSVVKMDKNINKANIDDYKSEVSGMDNIENSYVTDNVPPIPEVDREKNIPFENDLDYDQGIRDLQQRQEEIQKLSELKLYSRDRTLEPERVQAAGSNVSALEEEVIRHFGKDGNKLLKAGKLKIVDSVSDLPNGPHPADTKGVAIIGKSTYLVANNIDPNRLKGIVLHEVGVHNNIRNFLGNQGYNDLIKQMNDLIDLDPRMGEILNSMIPEDTPLEHINEEKLAYLVENMEGIPLVNQLLSKVKNWLFKNFPSLRNSLSLTYNDIATLAESSLKNYARRGALAAKGQAKFYSRLDNVIQESQQEIDSVNEILENTNKLRNKLMSDADSIADISDPQTFTNYIKTSLTSIDKDSGSQIYKDMQGALSRANEQALPNPASYAVKYAMDKLQYGLEAHKVALLHDRAIKQKLMDYLVSNWTGRENAGLRSLLIGTSHTANGSRAYTAGDAIRNNKRLWEGNLDSGLKKLGIDKLFYKGVLNDDIQKAMWLLEDKQDTGHLQPEAVAAAKHIMDIYDGMTDSMRKNGLVVNKIKHYLSNQQSLHNQTKIRAAGFDNWKEKTLPLLDINKTAEAMNIKPSDLNDEILRNIYDGFANGEHIPASGSSGSGNNTGSANLNGYTSPGPFSDIRQKQRKLIFKDANSIIDYRNAYGDLDFQAAVIKTISANSKKLGLLQSLGVNYERNLRELSREFINAASNPDDRAKLRTFSSGNMENMLKSIDGRADRPFSNGWARFGSNVRAVVSMARLGAATISAFSDLPTMASYLNRNGMGGNIYNLFTQGFKTFTKFSPERKQMLGSMGIFADSVMQDAYRDGNADSSMGKRLSKATHIFFSITGLDAWTNSVRLSAADSLMNHMSNFTDREFTKLPPSLQRTLKQFDINDEEWGLLRQTNQRQVDGNNYLVADEINNIRDKIQQKIASKGVSGKTLDVATDKYIDQLRTKLINFYHDGLSHMVIEPDAATKYYQTWGGLNPGSAGGEIARFAMQFKSFSAGFVRKVLFDQIYESHDTIMLGNRKQGGKFWQRENISNSFLFDRSPEGIQQKMNMAKFVAASTIIGYVSSALKDISKGRQPRPFLNDNGYPELKTISTSLLQGGGLGIFGDFIFGDFNRFGGGIIDTLAGPAAGTLGQAVAVGFDFRDLAKGYITGDKAKSPWAETARLFADNTPFLNAFYLRAAFNYAFFYGLQDYLNPGYLRRMERNLKKQNDQEYLIRPTQSAVRF